jgi:hypothetical protein
VRPLPSLRRAPRRVPPALPALLAVLAVAPPVLAACGSGSGSAAGRPGDPGLRAAGTAVEGAMHSYLRAVPACSARSAPVVCVEAADRTLSAQVHRYANVLAVGHGFSAPASELSTTRNAAQTLANSLEILGDAQPTLANYDQVRNTFDVGAAVGALGAAVAKLDSRLH